MAINIRARIRGGKISCKQVLHFYASAHKLTRTMVKTQITELLESGLDQTQLAELLGVTQPTVSRLAAGRGCNGETYKRVVTLHAERVKKSRQRKASRTAALEAA